MATKVQQLVLQASKCESKGNDERYAQIIRNVNRMESQKHSSTIVLIHCRPFVIKLVDSDGTAEELSCGDELPNRFLDRLVPAWKAFLAQVMPPPYFPQRELAGRVREVELIFWI